MKRQGHSHWHWFMENNSPKVFRIFGGLAAVILAFTLIFAAGYGLAAFIFRFTGTPSVLWAHVFSSFGGLLVLICVVNLIRVFGKRFRGQTFHEGVLNSLLHAMDKIAQGDFDVFIDTMDDLHYKELADGFNQMAKNLGTLESMRQDFISNVSHEIQSPLTSISGFAALLRNQGITPQQQAHYIDVIEAESKRLSKLSNNLLKLSVLETGGEVLGRSAFRLDRQLKDAILMLEPQWLKKNIDIEAEIEKTVFTGDKDLLSEVWVNLLHNAIKFTPEKSRIHVLLLREGQRIICRVSDTGIGIAPQDAVHIFERFYKADKSRDRSLGGNGLGLSLVKKIVTLHSGHISVDSVPGEGAVFTVALPADITAN